MALPSKISPITKSLLWQNGQRKLHPGVNTVAAVLPGKSSRVSFCNPDNFIMRLIVALWVFVGGAAMLLVGLVTMGDSKLYCAGLGAFAVISAHLQLWLAGPNATPKFEITRFHENAIKHYM
ncbi:MAG: hypothetical protein RSA56_00230 [Raoultibacter sp.]